MNECAKILVLFPSNEWNLKEKESLYFYANGIKHKHSCVLPFYAVCFKYENNNERDITLMKIMGANLNALPDKNN